MEFAIVIFILILIVGFFIGIYNRLVELKNRVGNSFAQIEVQLKRRYDLIPNLIEVAKKYMSYEETTLLKVVEARNVAQTTLKEIKDNLDTDGVKKLQEVEQQLNSAMGSLMVQVEAYPDLKASENMIQLNEELATTENKVSFARQAYNDSVMEYNSYKHFFPQVLVANSFGFKDSSLLEFENSKEIQEAPKVSFD
jgi:LemA protein